VRSERGRLPTPTIGDGWWRRDTRPLSTDPSEESRARTLLQDARNRQRDAREREERAARLELDRDKLNREQCAEMKRILQSKRQRLETMTPGERSDFERFEATWRGRCSP